MTKYLAVILAVLCLVSTVAANAEKPALQLAKVYSQAIDFKAYWLSEKYDGVRGYWNGHALMTRQGEPISAPAWFTANFPAQPLDGELWIARGRFDEVSGIVRRHRAVDEQWRKVRYMIFDLPSHSASFDDRLKVLRQLIIDTDVDWLQIIEQRRVSSEAELFAALQHTVAMGGEGLMLHKGSAHYQGKRTSDLLKLKQWDDAEAVVLAHLPGKGKYQNMLGALRVETAAGIVFNIGTGFSDQQRITPPPIGSVITFKYTGVNSNGVPRFASFMRRYQP